MEYALDNEIPFMIWLGEEEIKGGFVKIKVNFFIFKNKIISDKLHILIFVISALMKKLKKFAHVKNSLKFLNRS